MQNPSAWTYQFMRFPGPRFHIVYTRTGPATLWRVKDIESKKLQVVRTSCFVPFVRNPT